MRVLVFNCGSSSVKISSIDTALGTWSARGSVDRIGAEGGPGTCRVQRAGEPPREEPADVADHAEAVRLLVDRLPREGRPEAAGHRVVHGGERYTAPVVADAAVLEELDALAHLAPLHNPPNVAGLRIATQLYPELPQVAVFDTAFHATMPPHAYRYAVPERLYTECGVRRYGFHGLSHAWVAGRAAALTGRPDLRLVSLHLGNGCSAAAVRGGQCLDTSMGFTPLEGLVMGTRCGDLDPAVPLFLQEEAGLSLREVGRILNEDSGLEALAGRSDMRDLQSAMAAGDARARLAFDIFCYRIRKYVGAYAAALGGLDALVFTAGIGENSAPVRAAVCEGLEFLGVRFDAARNGEYQGGECDVSAAGSGARVLVVPTNEELMIARETESLVSAG